MTLIRAQSGTPSAAAAIKLSTYVPRVGRTLTENAAPMAMPKVMLNSGCPTVTTRAALASAPAIAPIMILRLTVRMHVLRPDALAALFS